VSRSERVVVPLGCRVDEPARDEDLPPEAGSVREPARGPEPLLGLGLNPGETPGNDGGSEAGGGGRRVGGGGRRVGGGGTRVGGGGSGTGGGGAGGLIGSGAGGSGAGGSGAGGSGTVGRGAGGSAGSCAAAWGARKPQIPSDARAAIARTLIVRLERSGVFPA
jgi:hypothetical protein